MAKSILISGATGKQGGSVVDALLERDASFTLLAVTRDSNSSSAKKLAAKSPRIKLVQGNFDDTPALFKAAEEAAGGPLWGVYSVQSIMGKGAHEIELRQGKAIIDESLANGVQFFVYSSVDRGGSDASWDVETPVPHFQTKYEIEHYLKDKAAGKMSWTVLRPTAFMDNFSPGMPAKVFMTAMRDSMKEKPNQWIATSDIGFFAAEAFTKPDQWKNKALSIAGDQLNTDQINEVWAKQTGSQLGYTFSFLGSVLKWAVAEMGTMIGWFASDGYGADIAECRRINPNLKNMQQWLESKNNFKA